MRSMWLFIILSLALPLASQQSSAEGILSAAARCEITTNRVIAKNKQDKLLLKAVNALEAISAVKVTIESSLPGLFSTSVISNWKSVHSKKEIKASVKRLRRLSQSALEMSNKELRKWSEGETAARELGNYFEGVKEAGNNLRNYFLIFDKSHRIPPELQSYVKAIGFLKDQLGVNFAELSAKKKRKLWKSIARKAKTLEGKLQSNPGSLKNYRFDLADAANVTLYLRHQLSALVARLSTPEFTRYDYHHMKKSIRSLSAFFQFYAESKPTPENQNLKKALKALVKAFTIDTNIFAQEKVLKGITLKDHRFEPRPSMIHVIQAIALRIVLEAAR